MVENDEHLVKMSPKESSEGNEQDICRLKELEREEDPYFESDDFMPTERKTMRVLRKIRWKDGVWCTNCGSRDVSKNGKGEGKKRHVQRYLCNSCESRFNDLTETIFEGTKLEIREWVYILRELSRNTSMNQISKDLERSYKAIMRVRDLAASELGKKMVAELKNQVEIDETYSSAGQKGTKCKDRSPRERGLKLRGRGTYDEDKPPIVAAVERGGGAVLRVAEHLSNRFIRSLLKSHVEEDSEIYHDDYSIYGRLPGYRDHEINHKSEGYAKGEVHVNTAEGLFSLLKSWLRTFRGVRKDNLWKFLTFFEFKFSFRDLDPFKSLSTLFGFMLPI